MTPTFHTSLLSAFLAGKSCSSIAAAHKLSIQDVLSWFESDETQTTLRRLESLQLQQARIVSFSILPRATGSLAETCTKVNDPVLQTRAASNLLRLGLRFSQTHRDSSETPSPREGSGGEQFSSSTFAPKASEAPRNATTSEAPSLREGVGGRESIANDLICSPARKLAQKQRSPHRETASQSPAAPRADKSTIAAPAQATPPDTFVPAPLLSRRESRVGALQSAAGGFAPMQFVAPQNSATATRRASESPAPDRPVHSPHPRDGPPRHASGPRNAHAEFQVTSAA